MNAPIRRSGTLIERTTTDTGIELHEIVPSRPDSPIPTVSGAWTIRRPPPAPPVKDS